MQHFEYGVMFWLQDRDEIWVSLAAPLDDQFAGVCCPTGGLKVSRRLIRRCSHLLEAFNRCAALATRGGWVEVRARGAIYQFVGAGGIARVLTPQRTRSSAWYLAAP